MNLSTWEWLSLIGGLLGVLIPVLIAMGRLLLQQMERRLDLRFSVMEVNREQSSAQWRDKFMSIDTTVRTNEQRLTQLLIDLPLHYQRREDAIRQEVAIIHRLDALALKVDHAFQCDLHTCPIHAHREVHLPGTP